MEYKDFNDYELINYISEGNEEANNILLKKYEPLIIKEASKLLPLCNNLGYELNDLVQEGLIGLNHAIERYQEQTNVLFYTYALKCIKRKMLSTVIAANRNKNKILNESISYDDEDNMLLRIIKDNSPNPEEVVLNSDKEQELMDKIKDKLTSFEVDVFDLLISGFKYDEISKILDKDKKSIDNAIQRIKAKIKKAINSVD